MTTYSPSKTRPSSKQKFVPSNCDDTLFGERRKSRETDPIPEWEPPWVDNGKTKLKSPPKPLLFYCPTAKSLTPSPSRNCSRASSASSRTADSRKFKPVKFSPTYVDNSLFGTRRTKRADSPPPKEFNAPWVKEEKKDKPLLFDGYSSSQLVFDSGEGNDSSRSVRTTRQGSASIVGRRTRPMSAVSSASHTTERRPWR